MGTSALLTAVHGSAGPRAWVCDSEVLSQLATVLLRSSILPVGKGRGDGPNGQGAPR